MFVRTTKVKQKAGVVEFVQLVHNVRHPKTGVPTPQIIHHFGRKDQLDLDALRRLIKSISRLLGPDGEAAARVLPGEEPEFEFLGSRQLGGTQLLDGLWKRLGIDEVITGMLARRGFTRPMERLLFAMVANRALAPGSKLAMENWVTEVAHVPELPAVEVHQLYGAMDFLLEAQEELQKAVFFNVATLLNLEVDVIFLDTTSTYFEVENEDVPGDERLHLRRRGYSKDNHPELAQVVVGFAVTREGIPVRCWVWPGNAGDQSVIDEVKRDLNGWKLGRVMVVADAGFNSEKNRRLLQCAGGHYILGEKLRPGSAGTPAEALSRSGRFRTLDNGLEIKEVTVGGDGAKARRYVIVRNPEEVRRDKAKRDDIVAEVEWRLAELKNLADVPHEKAACALRSHHVYGRYVTQTPTGRLTLHREKIKTEELVDGKFLVSSSDDTLSAEDIVLGYKALWRVERAFRDLKHVLDIRPVYHRLSDRIRAHVLLCWLALLLVRVAENETGQTWGHLRRVLDRLQVGIHQTKHGEVWQTSRMDKEHIELFEMLKIKAPPRFLAIPRPLKDPPGL
jgi:hypothetical protein